MNSNDKGRKCIKMIGFAFLGILIAIGFALIFSIAVEYLWNWVMVGVFDLPVISFWQAFGIILLAKILFGGFGHHHKDGPPHFTKKFECNTSPSFHEHDDEMSEDMAYLFRHKHLLKKFWKEKGREEFQKFKEAQEKSES